MTTWKDRWKATPTAAAQPQSVAPATAARKSDPWNTDEDRIEEINARSPRGKRRWLGRAKGWLTRW